MGQGASQPDRRTEGSSRPSRRANVFRRSLQASSSDEGQRDGLLSGRHSEQRNTPRLRTRQGSVHRLSQLLHFDGASVLPEDGDNNEGSRSSAMLQRTRSTFRDMLGRREHTHPPRRNLSRPTPRFLQHRTSYVRTGMNGEGADYYAPRLPPIDLTSTFDNDALNPSEEQDSATPPSSSSNRRPNLRLNALRPDRPFRHFPSLRRRRQSPEIRRLSSAEDQAAMLSRLLSVAAAATAATLMGDDHHALSGARSLTGSTGVGDVGTSEEDGSFDGFLRALQNGRIASALRSGGDTDSDAGPGAQGPLNFFRMFRFGASGPAQGDSEASSRVGSEMTLDETNNGEGRMVPIIIVGIRSIRPDPSGSSPGSPAEDLPPFIDALGSFPSPLPAHALGAHGHDSIDSILRPPQNGTSFRHRRRASLGGFGMGRSRLSDRMDDQRDHRSPDRRRDRPWSIGSSSSMLEPRPPPATPASPSPELSRISSRNTTPSHSRPASIVANSLRDLGSDSRRNSALHRASTTSPLSSHTEESVSLHSNHSSTNLLSQENEPLHFNAHRRSDTAPNIHYPRFSSGHSRRNGMVEPLQNLPSLSRSSTTNSSENSRNERRSSNNDSRSWIIYVLGGSYPENHPILTTPSLFTDNPTYEDMMLLSALLGPAKAPVATEEDVENAGGLYWIVLPSSVDAESSDVAKTVGLVAEGIHNVKDRIALDPGQRCLVCLCEFENKEVTRNLVKCDHMYHKECIDQVSFFASFRFAFLES